MRRGFLGPLFVLKRLYKQVKVIYNCENGRDGTNAKIISEVEHGHGWRELHLLFVFVEESKLF